MDDNFDKDHRYRFDEFEVDPSNRTLSDKDRPVKITGKVFDLLLVFIRSSGQLISKERLLDMVWGDEFIEEGNLAKAVSSLRKALGDARQEHRYIATVHGYGYRFLRPVQQIRTGIAKPGCELPIENGEPQKRRSNPKAWLWATLLISAVLGIVVIASSDLLRMRSKPFSLESIRQTRLTRSGDVYSPVISRSGESFVFIVSAEREAASVGLQRIGDDVFKRFTVGPPGAAIWGVSLSPDERYIYYLLKDLTTTEGSLFRIPVTGSTSSEAQKLADGVSGFAVSGDGTRIAILRRDIQNDEIEMEIIASGGGLEKRVLTTDLEATFFSIDWAPDGRKLLYSVRHQTENLDERYVAQISVDGGAEERMNLSLTGAISTIRWLPDQSALMAAAVDENTGQPQIYHISYPQGIATRITSDIQGNRTFSMAADGKSVMIGRDDDDRDIWVAGESLEGGVITRDTDKHFDTVEWAGNYRLIYDEDDQGTYKNRNIWSMRPDGSDRYALTRGEGNNTQAAVSPDGTLIVFVSSRTGKSQLWQMNADGSEQRQLTNINGNISRPSFGSSDAKVYFGVWSQGRNEVWCVDRQNGAVTPVVSGSDVIVWAVSSDEKRISYSYFDTRLKKVLTVDHDLDGGNTKFLGGIQPETWMRWKPDGTAISFNSREDHSRGVWTLGSNDLMLKKTIGFDKERAFYCTESRDGSRTACVRQTITYDAFLIRL